MGMYNIQVPPVGMRVPVTPNAKEPSSVPRKKSKEGSRVEQTMNAQDEIKELKQRIAELEEQVEQEQEFLQFREDYWFVDEDVEFMKTLWHGDFHDHKRLSINNVFKTKEQAEFALEKLKVEAELRKYSTPFKEDENNCFIQINSSYNNIVIDTDEGYQTQGTIYYETRKEALLAIDTVGEDRIKKYIFGVEDWK